jgi:cyanosortase A-associated protein
MMPSVRTVTLAFLLLGMVGALGRLLFFPVAQTDQPLSPRAFTFPDQVDLAGWQSLTGRPITLSSLAAQPRPSSKLLAGHVYQYQSPSHRLTIEMVYAIETNGNVVNFLDDYTTVPPSVVRSGERLERFSDQSGHYLLFVNDQTAYLASCINPRGGSTIILEQFHRNRYLNDFRPERLWRWFFKSESIRDLRCLWTNMAIPLGNEQPEQGFSVLEDTWLIWHSWWQEHFPKL